MPELQPGPWNADYDASSQTMTITFPNGRSYQFTGVPPDIYEGYRKADSKAAYYNAYIRGSY